MLYNWNGNLMVKMQLQDNRVPGKEYRREVQNAPIGQWDHYIFTYEYQVPINANAQMKTYLNGQAVNDNRSAVNKVFEADTVSELVLGRHHMETADGLRSNSTLDELLICDGVIDPLSALSLYQHYQINI